MEGDSLKRKQLALPRKSCHRLLEKSPVYKRALYVRKSTLFFLLHEQSGHRKSLLQCVAVCCSVLQYVAVCCTALQCVVASCSALHCVAVCFYLSCVAVCCSALQCVAVCFYLSCVAICCSALQCESTCLCVCVLSVARPERQTRVLATQQRPHSAHTARMSSHVPMCLRVRELGPVC